MGSSAPYMAAVALYRMAERPYVMSGLGILWGYVEARFNKAKRMDDPAYLALLHRFELESLLFGKTRTADRYHQRIRRDFPARTA
jgi:hypothetical protein